MADKVNIPIDLTIGQIRDIEKFQSRLAAATSKAFDNVKLGQIKGFNGEAFRNITAEVNRLGQALTRLQSVGGRQSKLLKGIFGGGIEGVTADLKRIRQVEAALRKVGQVALGGDTGRLKAQIDKYKTIFKGINFENLAIEHIADVVNEQAGLIEQGKKREARAYKTAADAAEKAAAQRKKAAQDAAEAEYSSQQRINSAANQNKGVGSFLARAEAIKEETRQLELEKQQIAAVNALEAQHLAVLKEQDATRNKINTERSVRSQIEAEGVAEQKLAATQVAIEKEVGRVYSQQLEIIKLINSAQQAGVAIENEKIAAARKFVQTDTRHIAISRVGSENGPGGQSVFDENFFRDSKRGITELTKQKIHLDHAGFSARRFGELTALAAKRYSAFLAGTFIFQKLFSLFSTASQQVAEFDKSLTKLRQVSNSTIDDMENLGQTIFTAAKRTGAGANDVAQGLLIFAQAGFDSVTQLKEVANTLAKLPLTSSFDDITSTANGLVAVFGQFGLGLEDTASILDRFNFVAKETAIESQDLIEAASKSGSSFVAAGADLNKFIELTTLLRSSTRESAAVVSTFFRTTLTKLGGTKQQNFLESLLGPDIRNLKVIDQLGALAEKFATLSARQKSGVLQSLVDVRQASRFGKLLEEINKQALAKNNGEKTVFDLIGESSGSVDQDVKTASDNLTTSFGRLQASFTEVIAALERDSSIKKFVKGIADITEGLAAFAKNGKIVIAIMTALSGIAALPALNRFAKGFTGAFSSLSARNAGASISSVGDINSPDPTQLLMSQGQRRFGRTRNFLSRNAGSIGLGAGLLGGIASTGVFDIGGNKPSANQNIFNRVLSNAGGGVAGGAAVGSVIPGLGTALGAAIGGATGAVVGAVRAIEENTQALKDQKADRQSRQIDQGDSSGFLGSLFGSFETNVPQRFWQFAAGMSGSNLVGEGARPSTASERTDLITKFLTSSEKNSDNFLKVFKAEEEKQIQRASKGEITPLDVQSETIKAIVKANGDQRKAGPETEQALRDVAASFVKDNKLPTLSEIEKTVGKRSASRLTSFEEGLISFFEDLTFTLNGTVQSLRDFARNIEESSDVTRKLSTVVTDFAATILPSLSGDNKTLISQNGGLGNFGTLQTSLAEALKKIVNDPGVATAISRATKDKAGGSEESANVITIQSLISQITDDATKSLATPIFAALQGLNGPDSDVSDVLKSLGEVGDNADELAGKITKAVDVEALRSDFLRKSAEALSTEITARATLSASLLSLRGTIFEISKTIIDSARAIRSRKIDQLGLDSGSSFSPSGFTPSITRRFGQSKRRSLGIDDLPAGLSDNQSNGLRAADALQTARTSAFGSGKLLQEILVAANRQRLGDVANASAVQRSGNISDPAARAALLQSQASQSVFEQAQQKASEYLDELGDRISAAADASNLLRSVFESLKGSVIAAGQAVRQLTKKEFSDILSDLRRFGGATGGNFDSKSLNKGFNALGPGGLDNVLKAFELMKDFNAGNGLTFGQNADKINSAFGAPAIAAQISAFTGKNVSGDDVAQQILKSLQEQREAAKLEQQLRKQQSDFYVTQKQVQNDNLNALKEQTTVLNLIANKLEPMFAIKERVDRLFSENLPVIFNPDVTPAEAPALPQFRDRNPLGRRGIVGENGTEVKQSVEVQPMLINVNLTAENLLNIIGPEIQHNIEAAISDKLSTVFADDPEKASKLGSIRPRWSSRDDGSFGG